MKTIIRVLVLLIAVVALFMLKPIDAQAADVSDLTFKQNYDGESYYVSDCSDSASGELEIPSTHNGKPVTRIGTSAFYGCSNLTSIIIPDSVTDIGYEAFYYCCDLTSITIPDSVTYIGDSAFSYCRSLTSITIPDSVTDIYNSVFSGCTSLTSITIPDSVTSIGDYAFYNCTSLTSITIPNSVTSIEDWAFSNCTSLTNITIPDSVTSIGYWAFENCTSLTDITIPDSVTSIDGCVFYDCSSLTRVTIGDGVTSIDAKTFYNCNSLVSIILPSNLTSIGEYVFYYCTSLTDITIPDSAASIGEYAFYYCTSLTDITIPDSTTSIGDWAFGDCSSLTSIIIGEGVTSIGEYAFVGCSGLTSIIIPDSVKSIGNDAFHDCRNLAAVTIGKGVTGIEYWAFYDCHKLENVYYSGTQNQWERINISNNGNGCLTAASIHYEVSKTVFADRECYYCPECDNYFLPNGDVALATISFLNWNGTTLSSQKIQYNKIPVVPASPTKEADNTYTYAFAGWDKEVSPCTGNETYTATYTPVYIDYEIVFMDWNGTVIDAKTYHYGDNVATPADPIREADNTYTYTFVGWNEKVVDCTGNTTYTAIYEPSYIDYTVVFKDWDGAVLSTKTYHYGNKVSAPTNPTKAADNTYTYAFSGWDKTVVACAGDAIYTAIYTPRYINYTVTFKNWNGATISTRTYHYGERITIPGNPTRSADNTYTYIFSDWDKAVVDCTGNATYKAIYTPVYINYTVVFKDWDGFVLSEKTYHYGDKVNTPAAPRRVSDMLYAYTFDGWDQAVTDCAGNSVYTATYARSLIDYRVVFKNWDGTVISSKTYHWGDDVAEPQTPTREKDSYYKYTFSGWNADVSKCSGNAEYVANFAAEHYHTHVKIITYPTCTEQGYTTNTCACGDVFKNNYIKETDHAYSNACDAECNVCTAIRSISHDYANATCTDPKTCTVCGVTTGSALGHSYTNDCDTTCNICSTTRSIKHTYKTTTTKATLSKDGSVVKACSVCGHTASKTTISCVKSFSLSTTNYTYNGEVKRPAVTVKDSTGKKLVKDTDYTVSYASGRKDLGTYNVVITMKGNYSGTKTLTFNIKLGTPSVTVSNATTGVKISWNKIAGAKNYRVYRSTYSDGKWSSWKAIKTGVTNTTYTDTSVKSNTNVKYTVRAFNGDHSSTYKSSSSIKFLSAPTVKVSNATNGVKITWNKISGAKSYRVYKSTYRGGKWSDWKAIKTGVTSTTYTDISVKSNDNVKYTVRAFNGSFSSTYKSSSSIKFLATPTVKAANAATGVKVTWNKISGAKTYTVYRSTYSDGKWSSWKSIKTGVTNTTYTDTSVKSGATVRYTVKAINGSFNSNVKVSNTTKFLSQPTVKVSKVTNGVKATWCKSTGATGYIVYRRTYANGKWSDWQKIKTTTALGYTDSTAKKGVTYQYTVRAYSGSYKSTYKNSSSIKR